jgi:hypothetical protein
MTHSDLLPRLGFKICVVRYTGDDVHLCLGAVDLGNEVPLLLDDPTAVKARLFVELPDSCVDIILSLLELPLGETPRRRGRISLNKKTLESREE